MDDNKIRCTCHLKPQILKVIDKMQTHNPTITSRNVAIERAVRFYSNAIYAAAIKAEADEKASKPTKAMNEDINQWLSLD